VKALAVVLAALLVRGAVLLFGAHVTVPVGAWPITMPLPVLALLAELGVCAVLGWLIARSAGWRTWPTAWRYA
jgi:hypothetical protein